MYFKIYKPVDSGGPSHFGGPRQPFVKGPSPESALPVGPEVERLCRDATILIPTIL